ncbi:hypothetical protein [Glycomyces tarimensis]
MQEFPMYATTSVHLRTDTATDARVYPSGDGSLKVGSWDHDNFEVVFHGSATMLRRLAEEFHKAADAIERDGERQRALDNAPRRRTKFVAEPVTDGEEMHIAA